MLAALLGILKTAGAPKTLETKITGESLFNDGVGVVAWLVMSLVLGFFQSKSLTVALPLTDDEPRRKSDGG